MSEENKNVFDENNIESNEQDNVTENDTVYFSAAPSESEIVEENKDNNYNSNLSIKKDKKRISIKTLLISVIAVAVASVMLTYSICSSLYQSLYAQAYVDANQNSFINGNIQTSNNVSELDVIAQLIKDNYYGSDIDPEKMMEAAIEEYIRQTGDIYAAYYTQAELNAMLQEDAGKMVGVGVNIINTITSYKGSDIAVLKVINVMKNSPAEKSGVKVGDCVYAVLIDGTPLRIQDLGYEDSLNKLLGEVGSTASFIALRGNGNDMEEITFNIVRENITTSSVSSRIPELPANADKKVGVVKITNFDYTTPTQFCAEIESLKKQGCEKFVFDVRYNPGGLESSVCAILSYFLNEGDVYIRTKDKSGNIISDTVKVITKFEGDYAGCNVSKEDIGKYKDLDVVVLCNEYTASAGELFTATFKDYELGEVIGNTTYGKGKLQTTYYLQNYALYNYGVIGIDGAVKITTHEYFSAKSDSYDGIGIEPNIKVELSEEALQINIYDHEKLDLVDDQLLKAINILKG